MSDDPQGIELSGRPAVTKMSKKPLYVVAVMLLILATAEVEIGRASCRERV